LSEAAVGCLKSEFQRSQRIAFKVGGFLKVGIDSWNTGLTAHFPPEPLLFDFLVQEAFGTDFCANFPLIYSPEPVNEAQAEEILRNSILAGKTWAAVEPSEIKVGKESLSFSGQLKKQPEGNTLGSLVRAENALLSRYSSCQCRPLRTHRLSGDQK